ncbi:MAG TPA: hypothetical protein VF395_13370 [Polyangiaceae bacterium]
MTPAITMAVAVLASAVTAHAAPRQRAPEVSGRARPIVELFVAGSDRGFASLMTALDSPRFAGFDLRWERLDHFSPRMIFDGGALEAGVHCFVDLSHLARTRLYCSDRTAAHFVLGTVPSGGRGSGSETAALSGTIGTALDTLLGQPASALSREQTEAELAALPPEPSDAPPPEEYAPATPSPSTAEAKEPFPLRPGAFYRLAAHSSRIPVVHGPGIEVALVDFGSRRRGTFFLAAAYELPASVAVHGLDLALSSLAFRAGAEASGAFGKGGTGGSYVGGRLAFGLDVTRLSPREGEQPAEYEPHPGTRSKSFVISAAIFWSLRLAPERSFFANLSADIDPLAVHYDVASTGAGPTGNDHPVETVIERFRVRPGLSVGLRLW